MLLVWTLIQYRYVLIKGENLDTERDVYTGRTQCDNEGGDPGNASTSHGTPELGSTPPELGEGNGTDPPLRPSERGNPVSNLDLGLPASVTAHFHFCYLHTHSPVCGGTWLRQPNKFMQPLFVGASG